MCSMQSCAIEDGIVVKASRRHRFADVHRDGNEDPLVELAEKLGAHVFMSGPLDFWCWARGKWFVIEIKKPEREGQKSEFTPLQKRFFTWCEQHGAQYHVWRTDSDVISMLGGRI